jgi:asparagine synthase (glutamine-hydrolysing)
LAIIDTSSAGHQPMIDDKTGTCITYNGEVYNFRELKSEIGNQFGPWRSTTDTEVVLRAYRKWGVDGLKRLRGMFAVAIWDQSKRELILARDRFGIKHLYYFLTKDTSGRPSQLLFSSEVRALLASQLVPRCLSRDGVASYLSFGSVEAPLTIIDGVNAVAPGECLIVRPEDSRLSIKRNSIRTQACSKPPFRTREEAAATLREKLEESVLAHLVSDVPLGVFLSGGMDSSALVALMSRVSRERARTFSVVFEDNKLNEARHSRSVADTFGTIHKEVLLREDQLLDLLPGALRSFDQPSMDGVNTYVVAKAVKEAGVTVALSGLGGDELFAGYPSFRRALQMHSASSLTRGVLRAASEVGRLAANGSVRRNKFWQLAASEGTPQDVYRITRQLFDPRTVAAIAKVAPGNSQQHVEPSTDPVNEVSLLELQGYMANTLLRDTDSMSMAHSLEVRVPFVDVDVVDFALGVPGKFKLNGDSLNVSKPLLRDAIADLLPKEFLSRRKMGFTLPFEIWMQSHLKNEISTTLFDQTRLKSIGLEESHVVGVWNRFLKSPGAVGWTRPWALYALVKWCEVNEVRFEL